MGLISGCTAYDLILVHNGITTTVRKQQNVSTATVQKRYDTLVTTTTEQPQQSSPETSSIGASECMFRFGTQCSSSDGRNSNRNDDYKNAPPSKSPTTAVYLVVPHCKTGDILRFPISAYNTIQQDSLLVVEQICSPNQSKSSFEEEQQQLDRDLKQQRQHDPMALQQLMDALTGANTSLSNDGTDHFRCGPYKANFLFMSIITASTTNNSSNDEIDNIPSTAAAASTTTTAVTTTKETLLGITPFRIFIYPCHTTKLGIVDVDGTITTSTLSGFWNTAVLQDYSTHHCHAGVCPFFTKLVTTVLPTSSSSSTPKTTNETTTTNIQLIYLTNRPITYVDATRNLLNELQEDSYALPKGPLIGFTGNLAGVFKVCSMNLQSRRFACSLSRAVLIVILVFFASFPGRWIFIM